MPASNSTEQIEYMGGPLTQYFRPEFEPIGGGTMLVNDFRFDDKSVDPFVHRLVPTGRLAGCATLELPPDPPGMPDDFGNTGSKPDKPPLK